MATLEKLERALQKADKAGNVEDAKRLAAEIRKLQQEELLKKDFVGPRIEGPELPQPQETRLGQAVASGAYKGLAGLASLPELALTGLEAGAAKLTGVPSQVFRQARQTVPTMATKLPSYEQITEAAELIPGAEQITRFEPQTEGERYAERISEFVAPGGLFARTGRQARTAGIIGTVGGATSAITEGLGPLASTPLTLLTTLTAGYFTQPSRAARYAREALKGVSDEELALAVAVEKRANTLGINITAPELIDNKILQGVGQIVYGSEKGGKIMFDYIKNRPTEISKVADTLIEQIAKKPESLRKVYQDVGTTAEQTLKDAKKFRSIVSQEKGYKVANTESISEDQVLKVINQIDNQIQNLPKGTNKNKLIQLRSRLIKETIKPEEGVTLLDRSGRPIPRELAQPRIIPETNVNKLDSIFKEFRDAVADSRTRQITDRRFIDKQVQGILFNEKKTGVLDSLNKELRTNKNYAKAKDTFQKLSEDVVVPVQDNLEVLLKGGVTPSKIQSFIFDPNKNNVNDIKKTYQLLNKTDKSVFPNLARSYIKNAADKAFIIKPEGVSLKSGFDLYKALAGTKNQRANFNQVLKGVAEANNVPPNDLIVGFNNFNNILKRSAKLANIDNPRIPPDARNLPAEVAKFGSFMWRVKFAGQFSEYLQAKTMEDLAKVFTKPESVKELVKLAKTDTGSNEAVRRAITIIALTEDARVPEEEPIR